MYKQTIQHGENSWLRVQWRSGIGICVHIKDPDTGTIFCDDTPFLRHSALALLLRRYAQDPAVWKSIGHWQPVSKRWTKKRVVEGSVWIVRIATIFIAAIMLIAGLLNDILASRDILSLTSDLYWSTSTFLLSTGLLACSIQDAIYYFQENIIIDDPLLTRRGLFFLGILGIVVSLAMII